MHRQRLQVARTENDEIWRNLLAATCGSFAASYTSRITKPPEGLGVRLVSAGPLFFFHLRLGLVALFLACCRSAPAPRAEMFPGVFAQPAERTVELQGRVACRRGFLEQVACTAGTREHESLVVVRAKASEVQAAMLAAGLRPGRPGDWRRAADGSIARTPPSGDAVEVLVRTAPDSPPVPVASWVRDLRDPSEPSLAFVFAGSRFAPARGGGERFVADESGSVVGLVTFGDEVVALDEVVPDRVDAAPARWQARTAAMPEEGAPVTLVLRARP